MSNFLIYLDNCAQNRPYYDFQSFVIFLEAEAKLIIQDLIKNGDIDLVWSYILEFENFQNPSLDIKESILDWKKIAKINIVENVNILKIANEMHKLGLGTQDSLHLACAIDSNCDFFITTDKGIIKKANQIQQIRITNPINFMQLIEANNENR